MAIFAPLNYWFSIIIALIVIGEAIALLVGMNFVSDSSHKWLSLKNNLLLLFDIVSGGLILYLVLLQGEEIFTSPVFYIAMIIVIASHLWRDIEVLSDHHNLFLANSGLLIVNNVKLIGAICSLLLAIIPSSAQ